MPLTIYPWHRSQWQELLRRGATLPHALLFRGREGTGKLDFVRKLAQSLACESPVAGGAGCGGCQSCRWFAAGTHPDYREMLPEVMRPADAEKARAKGRKPSTEMVVEEVRELHDFINLTSHLSRGKTIVFYPAETLNRNAANALLKNLEEPPASTRFMLVAHRPSYLPATVISRCEQVAMPTPQAAEAERWLRDNGVDDPELSLAHTANAPLAALNLNDREFWLQRKVLLEALATRPLDVLTLAERIREYPLVQLLGWLLRWSYDLLSLKSAGRVRYNPDFESVLTQVAQRLRAADIARFHRLLVRQQRDVHHPLNSRLFIEHLLLSYVALLRGEITASDHAG